MLGEIQTMAGIEPSIVYRTLKNPKRNKGKFVEVDGKWHLTAKKICVPG